MLIGCNFDFFDGYFGRYCLLPSRYCSLPGGYCSFPLLVWTVLIFVWCFERFLLCKEREMLLTNKCIKIYKYMLQISIYIYIYINNVSITYMLFKYICFSLCMFSGTNLLNIQWVSSTKRIVGIKTGVHNLQPLYL